MGGEYGEEVGEGRRLKPPPPMGIAGSLHMRLYMSYRRVPELKGLPRAEQDAIFRKHRWAVCFYAPETLLGYLALSVFVGTGVMIASWVIPDPLANIYVRLAHSMIVGLVVVPGAVMYSLLSVRAFRRLVRAEGSVCES